MGKNLYPLCLEQTVGLSGLHILNRVNLVENELTKEEIYRLRVECNDMVFTVAINKADLLGEPAPGRRFKGQIWMQGLVDFGVNDMLC